MPHYSAFGLTINTDIELPDLIAQSVKKTADLKIHYTTLTKPLTESQLHIQPQYAELTIEGIARYQIKQGKAIFIQQCPTAKTEDVNLFLLGSVMGIFLQQRGCLLLHACAIEHQGRAHLFSAHSGVGKSTLAYGLYQRGYRILTDDVACITYAAGQPIIHPGYPRLRLTQASADALNTDTTDAPTVVTCDKKYILSCHDNWQSTPLPISSINIIETNIINKLTKSTLQGMKKIFLLKEHSYRYEYLKEQKLLKNHFKQLQLLTKTTPMHVYSRDNSRYQVKDLMNLLEQLQFYNSLNCKQ